MYAVLRTEPGAGPGPEEILDRLEQASPDLPPPRISSLEDGLAGSVARERATAILLVLFGGLALVMAAVGIYGVASFAVTRRRHELGMRMALGARGTEVGLQVVLENLFPVLAGAAGGCLAALALGRLVTGLLYGVEPGDPVTLGAVALTLSLVGLSASLIPAHRATHLDPTRIMSADG
jgi:ABC-type antimicrobial peptide transport system permease subunit